MADIPSHLADALSDRYTIERELGRAERAAALLPVSRDALMGPVMEHNLVLTHIDPAFAPLRGHPRFQRLVAGK